MSGTTAKPPSFHLRVRLIDATGTPFVKHDFRVLWGKEKRTGQTSPNGYVDLPDLDGDYAIKGGTLELGVVTKGAFVPSLSIPLVKHTPEGSINVAQWHQTRPAMYYSPRHDHMMSYDVAWRLMNLGYLIWIPKTPSFGGSMEAAPSIPGETANAMTRFKAHNHETLGLGDWLAPGTSTSAQRLTGDQDDDSVKLLLVQHDDIGWDEAGKKLDYAKSGISATMPGGEPL